MPFAYTIFPLGDAALTVDFGNAIDEGINQTVLRLFQKVRGISPHLKDVVPAYASLTVHYDAFRLRSTNRSAFETVKAMIEPLLAEEESDAPTQARRMKIPVCYASKWAPDIEALARQKNLSVADVIQLHTAKTYRVYTIGFLPGFAYMGTVDSRLAVPRKAQPRTGIPAGSVGIAGEQTGIYPLASPGGWNIVGRTPVRLFDAGREESVLLRPGDEVQFYSITEDAFEDHQSRTA